MSEKPPKHKTKNKGHQKHRNQRQTKFFASVGVAKRGGGGRGGFHRRNQLDPEEAEKYGPREIESNAYKYEIEVDEESLQRDKEAATKEEIKRLTQDLGGASAYFRKAWEKDWDTDQSSELLSKGSIFALDMSQLAHSLEHLSLQERIKANPETLDASMRTQQQPAAKEEAEEDVITTTTNATPAVESAKKAIMFENLVNKQKQRRLGDPIEIVPAKYAYRELSNNAAPSSSEAPASKTPSTPATSKPAATPKQQEQQQPSPMQPIKTAPSPATATTPVQPSSPFIQQREPEPKPSTPIVSGIKGDNTSKAEIDFLDQLIGGNEKKETAAPKPSVPSSTPSAPSIQLKPATTSASATKKPQEDLDDWLSTIL